MSLYYETASFLNTAPATGSLKSRVFSCTLTKSPNVQIFALASEASKWSSVLAEVIEHAQLLQNARKLTPNLALLLVHDLLLTKSGISAPANHPLRLAVEKHKARLAAELTRARLRRGFASLEQLRVHVHEGGPKGDVKVRQLEHGTSNNHEAAHQDWPQPRWVRVNTLKTTTMEQLETTFADYNIVGTLDEIWSKGSGSSVGPKLIHIDKHIPNLLALPPATNLSKIHAYLDGLIILQDKASCFPAYLLDPDIGEECLDACAAPGNKTTHLVAILHEKGQEVSRPAPTSHASERDLNRASTLDTMVGKAGASSFVRVHRQDFLKLDPATSPCSHVGAVLLDPSCSGSGIVSRDETFHVVLPRQQAETISNGSTKKKRKRTKEEPAAEPPEISEEIPVAQDESAEKLKTRLAALSNFQVRLLLHAFHFPKAHKITYSTCSIYPEENENVIIQALLQSSTEGLGWRILLRGEQVEGVRAWDVRGNLNACQNLPLGSALNPQYVAEACIRCEKGTKEGTQGFFLAAFVREIDSNGWSVEEEEEEEWEGFGDT